MPQTITFDPSQPHTVISAGPVFDPSKPFTEITGAEDKAKPPIDQLGEAWQATKDLVGGTLSFFGHAGDAMHGYPQALTEDLKNLVGVHQAELAKAKDAFRASANPNEPVMQRVGQGLIGVQHGLAAAIPMQGPMAAGVAEDLSTGHVGRAAVNAAALFAPYAKEGSAARVAETVGANVERAGNVVGATKAADALTEKWRGYQASKAEATTAKTNQAYFENLTKAIGQNAKDPAKFTQALTRAKPYLVAEHATTSPLESIVQLRDAADTVSRTMHEQVGGYVEAFKADPIRANPLKAAQDALAKMPGSTPADVAAGLKEMAARGLTATPNLGRSFDVLTRLNAENQTTLAQNNYQIANVRATDPKFVAREAAAAALRTGIFDQLAVRGVPGVRELRLDQGAIITVRNAAQRQINNGQRGVSGTGKTGPVATMAGKAVEMASVGLGAKVGGPIGAAGAHVVGKDLSASLFARANQTRDALVARAFKKATGERPTYPEIPAPSPVRGLLTAPPVELTASPDTSYVRAVPAQAAPLNSARLLTGRQGIAQPASPDASYVRAVPGQYPARVAPSVRGLLPAAPSAIPLGAGADTSYVRAVRGEYPPVDPAILEARRGQLPFSTPVSQGRPIASSGVSERQAPPARWPVASAGGGTRAPTGGVKSLPADSLEHFHSLVPYARKLGYKGSNDSLAEHYRARLDEARTIAQDAAVSSDDAMTSADLLSAISKAGGIGLDAEKAMHGEVSAMMEALHRGRPAVLQRKSGYKAGETYLRTPPKNSAGLPGAPGIIKGKGQGGNSLDRMYESIREDPRWAHQFDSLSDFAEEIKVAIHDVTTGGTKTHQSKAVMNVLRDLLHVNGDTKWWESGTGDEDFNFGANDPKPTKEIKK